MEIRIYNTSQETGTAAAVFIADKINHAIQEKGHAHIIIATGASQFDMYASLVESPVDWSKVTVFHLDEYIGIPQDHPASFCRYLKERFVDKVSPLKAFHFVKGDAADPKAETERLGKLIRKVEIDIACIGIGENGHIAFNDPPADFETDSPYIVVTLDDACRRQQYGEGWFDRLEDVPAEAISMSVKQIMKSRFIACTVPDERKAAAVQKTVESRTSNRVPATILKRHKHCALFLDRPAASKLKHFKS